MERRWGNRFVLDETVAVKREGETIGFACLHEMSLSGAYLQTNWHLPQLTRVCLELPRARSKGRRKRETVMEAFVVRHCADGVGLEWCEFAPPEVAELMEERRQMAAPPVQLDRAHPRMRR